MKYGIVLPSYPYGPERGKLIDPALRSLEKTVIEGEKPRLLLLLRLTQHYHFDTSKLAEVFDLEVEADPTGVQGTEQTLAYGTHRLVEQGYEYVTWMGDDALFHPTWHKVLQKLIVDKPEALGWSVYRSAYELFHQTMREENGYVQVSTLCGHGMTMRADEWKKWGQDWTQGGFLNGGLTMDLRHAMERPGERWTTKVSYIEHTGRSGVHCRPEYPEWAVAFQGTQEW